MVKLGETFSRLGALGLALCAVAICGCGGGETVTPGSPGDTAPAASAGTGDLQFRVVFPKASRKETAGRSNTREPSTPPPTYDGSIPLGSHSVKIAISDPTSGALLTPERIVSDQTRPDGVTGAITVGFALLPAGPVKVDVSAFPDLTAEAAPLATGSTTAKIVANQTIPVSMLLQLTLKSFVVTPPTQTLHAAQKPFQTGTVNARALDAQGRPLLYPIQYSVDNTGVLAISSVSADFTTATITPLQSPETTFTVMVTATEPNSGTSGSVQVIIGP